VFVPGEAYRRAAWHELFGGQRQSGIVMPRLARAVFLFATPRGPESGDEDGWTSDGRFYLYTGEGQVGDMTLTGGDRAIAAHGEEGKALHLFQHVRPGWYRYVGEFEYGGHERRENVPDRWGRPRTAIVVRLRPKASGGVGS